MLETILNVVLLLAIGIDIGIFICLKVMEHDIRKNDDGGQNDGRDNI